MITDAQMRELARSQHELLQAVERHRRLVTDVVRSYFVADRHPADPRAPRHILGDFRDCPACMAPMPADLGRPTSLYPDPED
jgi:hypothetical protein